MWLLDEPPMNGPPRPGLVLAGKDAAIVYRSHIGICLVYLISCGSVYFLAHFFCHLLVFNIDIFIWCFPYSYETVSLPANHIQFGGKVEDELDKDEPEPPKGPLGLTTVYEPEGQAAADLIFVHGLNGGSRSTWSKADSGTFWPRDWLSRDDAFHDVRIHTFGYSSGLTRESVLDINDFANNLLANVHHCPSIISNINGPILFVGHSMGGLVIKKAYILAHQIPAYSKLAERLLSRFLVLAGPRPFVDDLAPQSNMLQSINEEFPQYSDSLQLFSLFETKPMFYGAGKGLIVEKHCAVMNYANERRIYLDGNHRDVAKYASPKDPSYILVRNALVTTINNQRTPLKTDKKVLDGDDLASLSKFLGVNGAPEDDLINSQTRKLPGSCQWLVEKDSFQQWRDALAFKFFWLRGRPGAGKTVLASHIVSHIRASGLDCCYFFFSYGHEGKGNVNDLLRSMAWQMAVLHPEGFEAIAQAANSWKEDPIDKIDHIPVWRRVFSDSLLKVKVTSSELMFFLKKAQEIWPLCILATSREGVEAYLSANDPSMEVVSENILEDNKADIASFLSANLHRLPGATIVEQQDISDHINQVLNNQHSDMNALYSRIVDEMSRAKFGKDLAKSLLVWATCAFRPLSVDEMHSAVEADIKDSVGDIGNSISTCRNLVFVDQANKIQLVHLTAREFLSHKDISPEFFIDNSAVHKRMALVCIQTLCGEQGNNKTGSRNRRVADSTTSSANSVFYDYASTFLFQHALQIESMDDEVFAELARFLGSREVLVWIEQLAKRYDLQRLYQAGQSCTNLAARRLQLEPTVASQKKLSIIVQWGTDLVRLVNKFGKRLNQNPSCIHSSIPPFCPNESALRKQFVNPYRGLHLQGCVSEKWDDRLCTILYPSTSKPIDIASSGKRTAITLSNKKVAIYDTATLLQIDTLMHQEPVWSITFGEKGRLFATGGAKTVRVWDLNSFEQVTSFLVPAVCLSMAFVKDDEVLLAAVKNNLIVHWDISNDISRGDPIDWTRDLLETDPQLRTHCPTAAVFSVQQNLLAVVYRGEDILLWALDSEEIYDMYDKEDGSHRYGTKKPFPKVSVSALSFGSTLEYNLLVAAYSDGDVVIFDTDSGEIQATLEGVNAQTIDCSSDGRTLVTADSQGNVNLFDMRTFSFIHRLRSNEDSMRVKKIAFTPDSLRLLNIGGVSFSIWDPTVLHRHEIDNDDNEVIPYPAVAQPLEHGHTEDHAPITAMTCMTGTSGVICGKDDGRVLVFNLSSSASQGQELFTHGRHSAIRTLHYDADGCILTCADTTGRVTSRKLISKSPGSWASDEILFDMKGHSIISQVIASFKHDRLLITNEMQDALWGLSSSSAIQSTPSPKDIRHQRWLAVYRSEDLLIRFGASAASFYEWETFTQIGTVNLDVPNMVSLRFIIPFCHPDYVATVHGLPVAMLMPRTSSHPSYHLWDLRELVSKFTRSSNAGKEESNNISPILDFEPIGTQVATVVGVASERVIFLDSDNWICSAAIAPKASALNEPSSLPVDSEKFVRHFFIPDDWISLVNKVQVDVRPSGEVIFANRADVAVIRRGLDIADEGASGNSRFSGIRAMPRRPANQT
ncbi:hypothetical protein F4808DRAFT_471256 [Astrocystis sublimbata]|nr:hypothetical protein F4808DRAFT_471256 [Astrocystis sublimbata]